MNCLRRGLYVTALLIFPAGPALSQSAQPAPPEKTESRRALTATRLTGAIVLDGKLEESAWNGAARAADFIQNRPRAGEAATQKTEARVLYDADAIYVAMRMYDTAPDSIAAQLARRDISGPFFSDWADVIIDSYADRRTAYRFSVNPKGVKKDVLHFNNTNEDLSWDAVWDVAVATDAQGWTAEFRIPLSQIRFNSDVGEQTWGINFGRIVARKEEYSFWSPWLPTSEGFVSAAGDLTDISGLSSPRRLEIAPYSVAKVTRAPNPHNDNPFYSANAGAISGGADLKYGLSSNFTLTATINPDFGQVEADPSVVNLSAFETFFSERRPFFLEGSNLFNFSIGDGGAGEGLFYSRRIGRAPQRRSFNGAKFTEVPEAATILGAAKVTGRTANGWSFGLLNALTQAEHASLWANGSESEVLAEPMTNYAVGRVVRDFRKGRSNVGAMMTAVHRNIEDDALSFLRSSAYAGGVDFVHRFGKDGRYNISGMISGSAIFGDTLSIQAAQLSSARYYQRPDADNIEYDPTRTSLTGYAANLDIGKQSGGKLVGGIGLRRRSPGYEINDVGFQSDANTQLVYLWSNFNQHTPGKIFRRWNVGFNPSAGFDLDGTRTWRQANFHGSFDFHNFWSANFFASERGSAQSVTALRGGPSLWRPGNRALNFNINSDRRKMITLNVGGFMQHEKETDGQYNSWWAGINARPSSQVSISLSPSYQVSNSPWQYVASPKVNGRTEYLFAQIDQEQLSLTARVNYTFTPELSLQFYAQPFVSAGDYSQFRYVVAPGAREFNTRFRTFAENAVRYDADRNRYTATLDNGEEASFGNPDFNVRALRTNAVMRWEYRPGSALFLVWSQSGNGFDPEGSFRFSREMDRLVSLRSTNVFLVKFSYWTDF